MKNKIYGIMTLILTVALIAGVSAGPVQQISIVSPDNPIYSAGNLAPSIYLKTSGATIVPAVPDRQNKYAFTGEELDWKVLVIDNNGVADIKTVEPLWRIGTVDSSAGNCVVDTTQPANGADLSEYGAAFTFNSASAKIYSCSGLVNPSASGSNQFIVKVKDKADVSAETNGLEKWYLNPSLDVSISGTVNFGTLGPGQQGQSTISISNAGEESGVQFIFSISGTDFYDPSNSNAQCGGSNFLPLQGTNDNFNDGFWYTALMGSKTVGNKRIPYGSSNFQDSDPIFSSSNKASNWKDWSTGLVTINPGSDVTMTLHLGLPQSCYGHFTQGQVNLGITAI